MLFYIQKKKQKMYKTFLDMHKEKLLMRRNSGDEVTALEAALKMNIIIFFIKH